MLVQPSYVSSNLLCLSHPLMLGLTQSGTNMGQTLHYITTLYIGLRLDTSHKISVIFMLPMSKFRENGDHIVLNLAKNRENNEN